MFQIEPVELETWLLSQPEVVGLARRKPRTLLGPFVALMDYYKRDESPLANFMRARLGTDSVKCHYHKVEVGFPVQKIQVPKWLFAWDDKLQGKAGQPVLRQQSLDALHAVTQPVPQAPPSSALAPQS